MRYLELSVYLCYISYYDNTYVNNLFNSKEIHNKYEKLAIDYFRLNNIKPIIDYKIDLPSVIYFIHNNIIFISFPGMRFFRDKINCLNYKLSYFPELNCSIHTGFLNIFKKLKDQIQLILDSNKDNYNEIIFTGHSLGGVICKISSLYFNLNKYIVSCYTFATPQIGDNKLVNLMNTSQIKYLSICSDKDILIHDYNKNTIEEIHKYTIKDNKFIKYECNSNDYIYNILKLNFENHKLGFFIDTLIKNHFII